MSNVFVKQKLQMTAPKKTMSIVFFIHELVIPADSGAVGGGVSFGVAQFADAHGDAGNQQGNRRRPNIMRPCIISRSP